MSRFAALEGNAPTHWNGTNGPGGRCEPGRRFSPLFSRARRTRCAEPVMEAPPMWSGNTTPVKVALTSSPASLQKHGVPHLEGQQGPNSIGKLFLRCAKERVDGSQHIALVEQTVPVKILEAEPAPNILFRSDGQ